MMGKRERDRDLPEHYKIPISIKYLQFVENIFNASSMIQSQLLSYVHRYIQTSYCIIE